MILTYNIRIFICLNYNTPYVNASVLHCVTFIICIMVGPQVSTSDQGSNLLGNAQTHNGKHSLPWEKHTLNWRKQLRVGKENRARVPFHSSLTSCNLKLPWSHISNPDLWLSVRWLKLAHGLSNCNPARRGVRSIWNCSSSFGKVSLAEPTPWSDSQCRNISTNAGTSLGHGGTVEEHQPCRKLLWKPTCGEAAPVLSLQAQCWAEDSSVTAPCHHIALCTMPLALECCHPHRS